MGPRSRRLGTLPVLPVVVTKVGAERDLRGVDWHDEELKARSGVAQVALALRGVVDIFDPPVARLVKERRASSYAVFDDGTPTGALNAVFTVVAHRELRVAVSVEVWLARNHAHRAAGGVLTPQGALGATQYLDPLEVEKGNDCASVKF